MRILALGLIEVIGYTAAIEAADAAIKSADVRLDGVTKVKGGLVTVILRGDVAPVQAAVDSATAAIAKMGGDLISAHVIPRPDGQVDVMLKPDPPQKPKKNGLKGKEPKKNSFAEVKEVKEVKELVSKEDSAVKKELPVKKDVIEKKAPAKRVAKKERSKVVIPTAEELGTMTVSNLRRLARTLELKDFDRNAIKFARKDLLISKITEAKEKKEGKEE